MTATGPAGGVLGRSRPAPSEADFQQLVIDLAHLSGWRVAHFRAARTAQGWRTAVTADGAGFVDLVLVRDRVLFVELKSDTGRLTPLQREWLIALRAAGSEVHVWRPGDWPEIEAALRRPA